MAKVTISVIKADIGGYVGHSRSHPKILQKAEEILSKAKADKLIKDFRVLACGDDLQLIMTHTYGVNNEKIHRIAWDTFVEATNIAKKLKLYGAGQDLLKDAFSGTVKGMGPGAAEMEFEERKSEPVIVFMADKTSPGAWNLPLYRIFADPFNTAGLIIDPSMCDGFKFTILDLKAAKKLTLACPEDSYKLLAFLGAIGLYVITEVRRKVDNEIAASASSTKLSLIAGKYVGKDDPVLIVRAQAGLPAVGEVLEAFAFPHLVPGFMRGSHHGPLTPVPFKYATPSRFDGPPRVIAAGFQIVDGMLDGPVDMFDDPSFDYARQVSGIISEYIRRHGPFEPHRLPPEEMEYTTLPQILENLKSNWIEAD